ncbi:hypothetical protein TRFO_02470 [Tritrichomonas foetus]|uniref:Uncharacterized protein n=1 Tax=Tritrichomonas foetus TaxID=1144522 RepID=A0A1J4L619_9EUKA|nr:hypothetical protein TRFO_02470 [Tritrichomonas foetus]|eukprot:OHT17460.1 hypothetical protein TRFO_02470 [Tritrichomonas foetus]
MVTRQDTLNIALIIIFDALRSILTMPIIFSVLKSPIIFKSQIKKRIRIIMSGEAIPSANLLSDSSANDISSLDSSQNSARGETLAQQLINLQQENLVVGRQNQELALQLHDASTYNQALGFDLYQLDQEIGELETRLANTRNQIKSIDAQTKEITKKADECKNALLKDSEFSALAKKLRSLQKTHQAAAKGLDQLRNLLGDPQFSMLDGALQLMQEKIHFLYWSNTELHQQIELMRQLLNEGKEGAKIEEELDKLNDISNLKLEWLEMRLYESQLKDGKKSKKSSPKSNNSKITPEESTKYILSPSKNNKKSKEIIEKIELKEIDGDFYQDIIQTKGKKTKIFRRPVTDKNGKKRQYFNKGKKKIRRTRVQNNLGDEYEYEYEFNSDLDEETKTKVRIHPKDEIIVRIDGMPALSGGFIEIEDSENEKKKIRRVKGQDGQIYEDVLVVNPKNKSTKIVRRPLKNKKSDKKKYHKINDKKVRHKRIQNNDGIEYEYEYEYDFDNVDDDGNPSKNVKRIHPKDEEIERIDGAIEYSDGFFEVVDSETGDKRKIRKIKGNDGKDYEDIQEFDSDGIFLRITRTEQLKNDKGKKYNKVKGSKNKTRRSRVLNDKGEEYEYEYEYDENEKTSKKKIPKNNEKIEKIQIEDDSDNENDPDNEEDTDSEGFRYRINKETGRKERYRRFTSKDGKEYEDVEIIDSDDPDRNHCIKRNLLNKKGTSYNYKKKRNPKTGRIYLSRHERKLPEDGYEYEYDYQYDSGNEDENEGEGKTRTRSRVLKKKEEIPRFSPIEDENGFRLKKVMNKDTGEIEKKRLRYVEFSEGQYYQDTIENNPTTNETEIIRRLIDNDNYPDNEENNIENKSLKYFQNDEGHLLRRSRVHRLLLNNDNDNESDNDEREYDYEYEVDDEGGRHLIERSRIVNEKDEAVPSIILKSEIRKKRRENQGFEEVMDKKKGKKVFKRRVRGKKGEEYEDILESDSEDGKQRITRKIISSKNNSKLSKEASINRRSRVQNDDNEEYEYEYESEGNLDNENQQVMKKKIAKKKEILEKIGNGPSFEFKEKNNQKDGETIKTRRVLSNNGDLYEDTLTSNYENDQIITRRIIENDGSLVYHKKKNPDHPKRKLRCRRSKVLAYGNEEEFEYEYDDDENTKNRKFIPKDEEIIESIKNIPKISNKKGKSKPSKYGYATYVDPKSGRKKQIRKTKGNNGQTYEYTKELDDQTKQIRITKRKTGENAYESRGNKMVRKTEVIVGDSEREYEYEYDEGEDSVTRIKMPKKDEDGFYKGLNKRTVLDYNGNEYEDTINKKGKIYRRPKHLLDECQKIHTRVRNTNDEEYEYEYEDDSGNDQKEGRKKKLVKNVDNEIIPKIKLNSRPRPHKIGKFFSKYKGRELRHVVGSDGNIYEDERIGDLIKRSKLDENGENVEYKIIKDGKKEKRRRHVLVLKSDDEEVEYEYEYDEDDKKSKTQVDEHEIESLLTKDDFIERIDPKTGKSRFIRKVKAQDGSIYEDEENPETKKITRRKLANDGQLGLYYEHIKKNKKRTRRSRVRNPENNSEYEYEYELNNDDPSSSKRIQRRRKSNELIFPIEEVKISRYISDSTQYSDEEDPTTGNIIKVKITKNDDCEEIIDPKTGKPMTMKIKKKKYQVVLDQKTKKAIRRRNLKLDNNDDLEIEYDDNEIDENGNPKRKLTRIINENHLESDSEGFVNKNGLRIRRKKGKNGNNYIDTIEKGGRIKRRVVDSEETENLRYQKKKKKLIRHSRVHDENGDEREYEYEYDNEDDNEPNRKIVSKKDEEIEKIKKNDFEEIVNQETGEKVKIRRIKGKKGEIYEDILDKNKRITRRRLDNNGEVLHYTKIENGKSRRTRVRNENLDEYEYEYEYDYYSDNEGENNENDHQVSRKRRVHPINENIDRIDGSHVIKGGFYEAVDENNGKSKKIRKVKSSNGKSFEDELIEDESKIKRKPLNKKGHTSYKKKNDKIVRHERVQNHNGEEYEYEYEYDEDDKCNKKKVPKDEESIESINPKYQRRKSENESEFEEEVHQINLEGFSIRTNKDTGQEEQFRRFVCEDGKEYEDIIIFSPHGTHHQMKRNQLNKKGEDYSYKKKKNPKTGRVYLSRHERKLSEDGYEYEYEYQYDSDNEGDNEGEKTRAKTRVSKKKEEIPRFSPIEDENGFRLKKVMNKDTGEIEKKRLRYVEFSEGQYYQDTIENNPTTNETEIIRRIVEIDNNTQNGNEIANLVYFQNESNRLNRYSRVLHLSPTGEDDEDEENEYEYEYEVDDEDEKGNLLKRKRIKDKRKHHIDPIKIDNSEKYRSKSSRNRKRPKSKRKQSQNQHSSDNENDVENNELNKTGPITVVKKGRPQSQARPILNPNPQTSESNVSGVSSVHLPVALFLSEDRKPTLHQSTPAFMQQPRPTVVDLSVFENAANLDKENPLSSLIPKLRAEADMEDDAESLQKILEALQQQIIERTAVRDNLREQVRELENPKPKPKKKRNKFKISEIKRVNIEAPVDPIKALSLHDFSKRSTSSQTELTSDALSYQQSVLEKQRKEKQAAEELRVALEALKTKIRNVEDKIEIAKEDGIIKENRIKALKTEISNVKDELVKDDADNLREEERSREYAQQLSEMDDQIRLKQQQLEKVNSQVGALHLHLKEMQRFRVILESELTDLVNREKPEVRQLIEDVKSYRVQIDVSSANLETMTKKVEAKRKQLDELLTSDEMKHYNDLKMRKLGLERRIKKWNALMKDTKETLTSLEVFSAKNATMRKNAVETLKNKTKHYLKKEIELEDLEKYQELLEAMIMEHKQNWM